MPDLTDEILRLDQVTVADAPPYDVGLSDVSLSLAGGDLATVLLDRVRFRTPLPDVACGVAELEAGNAIFLGKPWTKYFASAAARHRGMIGRVFDDHPWVSNLDVDENVLLPHLHHRHGSAGKLRERARELAGQFGLNDLPTARPVATRPDELKRAACVRAFLDEPRLLVLQRPTFGVYPDLMDPLLAAIERARARGAAVLWLEDVPDVFDHPKIRATVQYRMNGPRLELIGATPPGGTPHAPKL